MNQPIDPQLAPCSCSASIGRSNRARRTVARQHRVGSHRRLIGTDDFLSADRSVHLRRNQSLVMPESRPMPVPYSRLCATPARRAAGGLVYLNSLRKHSRRRQHRRYADWWRDRFVLRAWSPRAMNCNECAEPPGETPSNTRRGETKVFQIAERRRARRQGFIEIQPL